MVVFLCCMFTSLWLSSPSTLSYIQIYKIVLAYLFSCHLIFIIIHVLRSPIYIYKILCKLNSLKKPGVLLFFLKSFQCLQVTDFIKVTMIEDGSLHNQTCFFIISVPVSITLFWLLLCSFINLWMEGRQEKLATLGIMAWRSGTIELCISFFF